MYHNRHHQGAGAAAVGAFTYSDNANSELTGSGYQGRFTGNRNSNVYCENATVNLLNNRNVKAQIFGSNVTAKNESNFKLLARASKIEMQSNKNIDVEAEDAWCKFEDNGNLDFHGGGGANDFLSEFVGNRNSKFRGRDNNIVALKNKNLSIAGNNNRLEISNTHNHDVQPAATNR